MMKSSATEAISLSSSANGAPERTEQSIRFEVPITNFETTTVIDWRLLLEQRIEEEEADDDDDDDDDDDEDEDGEQGDDDDDDEDEDDDDEENDDGDDNGDDDNEPNGAAPPNDSKAVNARKWLQRAFLNRRACRRATVKRHCLRKDSDSKIYWKALRPTLMIRVTLRFAQNYFLIFAAVFWRAPKSFFEYSIVLTKHAHTQTLFFSYYNVVDAFEGYDFEDGFIEQDEVSVESI
jgi:hypothetical protein